jgi:predicted transcriptional regulator
MNSWPSLGIVMIDSIAPISFSKLLILRDYRCTISVAMGKKQQSQKVELPTAGELRLLQILWRIREGTIDDIVMASEEEPPPNYKTVQAWLRIMERKRQVDHKQDGRAFVFRPLISRGEVHRLSIRHLLARYFTGSRSELLMELLNDERISPEELRELEGLVRNRRKELL